MDFKQFRHGGWIAALLALAVLTVAQRASAEDEPAADSDPLDQMAWIVGDWVDESPDSLVETSYRWDEGGKYIVGAFHVRIEGRPAMKGEHRITWDPIRRQIRSWLFDSQGGFAQGFWTNLDGKWLVQTTGVSSDGLVGSSTALVAIAGEDRIVWDVRLRVVGGEVQEPQGPITIVRRPPSPDALDNEAESNEGGAEK